MISQTHRAKINEAKYLGRLKRFPWRLRCLPHDPKNVWLPLPPETHDEVSTFAEAALNHRSVEMPDHSIAYPRLVSTQPDVQHIYLHPVKIGKPQILYLRWTGPQGRVVLLVNPTDLTYHLSVGPTVLAVDVDDLRNCEYPKTVSSERWLAWMSANRPNEYAALRTTRP